MTFVRFGIVRISKSYDSCIVLHLLNLSRKYPVVSELIRLLRAKTHPSLSFDL